MQRVAAQRLVSARAPLAYSRQLGGRRWQSSGSTPRSGGTSFVTYVGIGLGFSTGLAGLGYAYYHFSGLKAMVDRVLRVKAKVEQVKGAFVDQRPQNMAEAVAFLRSISKSQQGPVPDAFVDAVAQYQGAHDEDIDNIVFGACDDIRTVLAHTNSVTVSEKGIVVEDRVRIVDAVQRRAGELRRRLRERRKESEEQSEGSEPAGEDGEERRGVMARIRARRAARGQQRAEEESSDDQ